MTVAFPSKIESCASHISDAIYQVFARLDELTGVVVKTWELAGGEPTSRDFASLRMMLRSHLQTGGSWINGTGVVFEPGAVSGTGMHLEWLRVGSATKGAGPNSTPLTLNFNQDSDSFYNYQKMPWFAQPKESGKKVVVGPYVDVYGADMYIFTFAVPILIDGRFIGIAGADIGSDRLERLLLDDLVMLDCEAMVLTQEGRVVAANTSTWMAGEIAVSRSETSEDDCNRLELAGSVAHWTLLERPSRSRALRPVC